MITRRLPLSRQAAVAAAAFFAFLIVVMGWGTASLVATRDLQAQFEDKSRTLEALRRQTGERLVGGIRGAQSEVAAAAISAPSETVAASELHKAVLAVLEHAGGSVHSIQAEATTDVTGDGLHRLNAQITFDGSTDALQRVLFDLETGLPFVFVDSLLVQPAATLAPGEKPGQILRITLAASSYWKGLEPKAESH